VSVDPRRVEIVDLPAFPVTRAAAYGLSRWQVESAVAAGALIRLGTGVVAGARTMSRDPTLAHLQLVRAAQLRMRGIAAASHGSAATLHGLARLGRPAATVRLTCDRGRARYRQLDMGAKLHVAGLPLEHLTTVHGVIVTTVARTVADLSRTISFRGGVVLADSALRAGMSEQDLQAVLDYCCRWPGRRRALAVARFSSGLAESPLESVSRVLFAEAGLPRPELQVPIFDGATFIARVDFRWGRVIGEADGMLKYDEPLALRREKVRQMALEDLGYEVVRWTWDEVWRAPDVVLARVRRALRRVA
jgi:predicted transcriptional regulator of viral defense system